MPLKTNKPATDAKAKSAAETPADKDAKDPNAAKETGDNPNSNANQESQAPAKVLVGDKQDLDPDSEEGQAWIVQQARRQKALDEQKLLDEQALEQKRREDEEAELKKQQDAAREEREQQARDQEALEAELAKKQDTELKNAPKPGRYAAVKSRLRDPISGKSFLTSQSTIVKKADITKWFIKQYEANLLTEFDEAEEEE